jgi:hypothetical protein
VSDAAGLALVGVGVGAADCTLAGVYQQAANITLSGQWTPIGSSSTPFAGTFNGGGFTITGLTINAPTLNEQGMFAYTSSTATLQNIGLVNVLVTGGGYVGGLVGYDAGSITNSYATGLVTGGNIVGGLVGYNEAGSITNSYATGSVTGANDIGGLVGANEAGPITNSYATGSVTGSTNVGGLVGNNDSGPITNSYATGAVTGSTNVGGLVGYNDSGLITNSFWDTVTSGTLISEGGNGLATAAMKSIGTFTGVSPTWRIFAGWRPFNAPTEVWGISPAVNNGYPYLLWQLSSLPNASPVFSSGTAGSGVAGVASNVYTAVATDADGNSLTYSLGSAVAGFAINSSTGVVSMGAGVAAGSYVLNVVASDGTASATRTVTVTVSAAPNVSPVFTSGLTGSGVAGVASSVYTAVATDADGNPLTYLLGSAVAGFTINSSTGVVSMGAGVVAGSYVLNVVVSDGTASVTQVVTVTVSPAAVLARTGSDVGGLSTGALALLILGLVAVAFTRRQERGNGLLIS